MKVHIFQELTIPGEGAELLLSIGKFKVALKQFTQCF